MINIALIRKNNCSFEKIGDYASQLLYRSYNKKNDRHIKQSIDNYIWNIVEPYITFIEIDANHFLDESVSYLAQDFENRVIDKDFYIHCETSYSFPKKCIEIMYCDPTWKEYVKHQEFNMNKLSCLFSLDHHIIENNCIVYSNNYDVNSPDTKYVKLSSITKNDIIRMIRRRFYQSAIIARNNSYEKYYYQRHDYLIMSVFGLSNTDKIEKLSTSLIRYNLVFYFKYDKKLPVNESATRINGAFRLYGDVVVIHEISENIGANLSIAEIRKLDELSYGRLYDRELKNNEAITESREVFEDGKIKSKEIIPFWSRYMLVESRIKTSKKDKCIYCGEPSKPEFNCTKCYRVQYCCTQCVRDFKNYHDDECINPKSL